MIERIVTEKKYGDIINGLEYIPKDQRRTILLLSDDIRFPSGIGTMGKEFVLGTCHHYNWIQVGAAAKHPEEGKIFILDDAVKIDTGVSDASIKIYCRNGYGDPNLLRWLFRNEKIDGILHFTDPRFWIWLYQMESEIRMKVPIMYYNIWDDLPYPHYNLDYYRSCDLIMNISKQTQNIVKNVLGEYGKEIKDVEHAEYEHGKTHFSYVPHGINKEIFFPLDTILNGSDEIKKQEVQNYIKDVKTRIFGSDADKYEFVILYNNRNIRRKMTGDVMLAYKKFCSMLTPEKREKVVLLMHTDVADPNGTDLEATRKALMPDLNVVFDDAKITSIELNVLYNISDVTINLASNEGFGLATAESLMCGTPIIVNVTGGLQDQCGFVQEDGKLIEFSTEFPTNHAGKYQKCGTWALPVFPKTRSLQGSIPTPYIFDDRCDWNDAGDRLFELYIKTKEQRKAMGTAGREFVTSKISMLNSNDMSELIGKNMKFMLDNWKIQDIVQLIKTSECLEKDIVNTGIIY